MKHSFFVLFLFACIAGLFNCFRDGEPFPVPQTGTFKLHLHSNIDTNEIDLGSVYKDADGRQIQLDVAQFYISNIRLKKADGTYYNMTGAYVLKQVAEEEYLVGDAPVGEYKSVTFDVGVDATANHQDPGSFPSSSPLSRNGSDTWYGSTAQGFVFMNVAGMVDTSAGNNGPVNFPVSYKIGSDALLKTVTMADHPVNFQMEGGQTMFIHIICDYGALLKGINFKTQPSTTSYANPDVATQVANNIPSMFTYEQ